MVKSSILFISFSAHVAVWVSYLHARPWRWSIAICAQHAASSGLVNCLAGNDWLYAYAVKCWMTRGSCSSRGLRGGGPGSSPASMFHGRRIPACANLATCCWPLRSMVDKLFLLHLNADVGCIECWLRNMDVLCFDEQNPEKWLVVGAKAWFFLAFPHVASTVVSSFSILMFHDFETQFESFSITAALCCVNIWPQKPHFEVFQLSTILNFYRIPSFFVVVMACCGDVFWCLVQHVQHGALPYY